jgi:predicted metalloendopeptidase
MTSTSMLVNSSTREKGLLLIHTAGGWQSTHSIPEDRGLLGSFNQVSDNNKVCHSLGHAESTDSPENPAQNHQRYSWRRKDGSYRGRGQLTQAQGGLH